MTPCVLTLKHALESIINYIINVLGTVNINVTTDLTRPDPLTWQMEGWKRRGLVAGSGIPAPSGRFTVGCVDICQSDLLVRLMYPTSTSNIGQYEYARWFPHPNYIKASMKYLHIKPACLVSSFLKVVLGKYCL